MSSALDSANRSLSTALQQQLGGLSMPQSISNQLMATLTESEKLPREPEWYEEMRALVRATLNGRCLSAENRELIHELITHIEDMVEFDTELDAFAAKRYRSATEHLKDGRKLNYYDEKMLNELCELLATLQGLKTQYKVSAIQDEHDPNTLRVQLDFKPLQPMETIEVKFELVPAKGADDRLQDSDDVVFTRTVMKRAMTALKDGMERRITMAFDKREQEARQQQLQQQPIDEAQMRATAYRAGLFGSGIGGLKAAYGPMVAMETA